MVQHAAIVTEQVVQYRRRVEFGPTDENLPSPADALVGCSRSVATLILLSVATFLALGLTVHAQSSLTDTLAPFGAEPTEPYTTQVTYDAAAQAYRFTYSGSDIITYTLPLRDWSLQSGLIRVNARINDSAESSPVAWAGPRYRSGDGSLMGAYAFATQAQTTLTGHDLTDGVVTLSYTQTFEGVTLNRTVRFWLQGRTLTFRVQGGTTAGQRNYAGFDFDRSENTPDWQVVEIPFLPDPIVAFGGQYFYSTYLDRTLSSSLYFDEVIQGYSSTSVYAAFYSYNLPDSANQVAPLDETGYITVSDEVLDVLPRPNNPPSSHRAALDRRVVLDMWRNGWWSGRHDPVRREAARVWVSPGAGTVRITGHAYDADPNCGDGVIARILKDVHTLWAYAIANGDTVGANFDLTAAVTPGDELIFRIERRTQNDCDSTVFNPTITFEGQTFNAAADFSGTQGYHGWYYREFDGSSYQNMTWDAVNELWQGSSTYSQLWGDGGHPGRGSGADKSWAKSEGLLRELHAYGLADLAVIYHDWQHHGYDVGLPTHYPANPTYGTPDEFRSLVNTATGFGWLFALHENYVDMYPSSALYNEADIAKNPDLSLKLGWYNSTTGEQAYVLAIDKARSYADAQGQLIAADYAPNASYRDVNTAWQPIWDLDMDAANPTSKTFASAVAIRKALFRHLRELYGGPLFGEGGEGSSRYDTFYAGYVDGVERQIEGRFDAKVIPDFELPAVKPLMVNHGMGYYGRYFVPSDQEQVSPTQAQWDQYRATEITYGHAGFISEATIALSDFTMDYPMGSLEETITEYYLLQPLQSQYLPAAPLSIRYRSGDQMLSLSQAIHAGLDFVNAQLHISYANGLELFVNRHQSANWTVSVGGRSFELPPNGWVAVNPSLSSDFRSLQDFGSLKGVTDFLEFSALLPDGTRADYVRSPAAVFARSRDGVLRTIEDLSTDGTAALVSRLSPDHRDVHLASGTTITYTAAPYGVLNLSQRTNFNLSYGSPNRARLRFDALASGPLALDVTYADAPVSWRDADGNLPAPDSGVIRLWAVDPTGERIGPVLPWTTVTGKEMVMQGLFAGQTYELYHMCPPGDVTDDGRVTPEDVQLIAGQWHVPNPDPLADLDGNGLVDVLDVMQAAARWDQSCPGR